MSSSPSSVDHYREHTKNNFCKYSIDDHDGNPGCHNHDCNDDVDDDDNYNSISNHQCRHGLEHFRQRGRILIKKLLRKKSRSSPFSQTSADLQSTGTNSDGGSNFDWPKHRKSKRQKRYRKRQLSLRLSLSPSTPQSSSFSSLSSSSSSSSLVSTKKHRIRYHLATSSSNCSGTSFGSVKRFDDGNNNIVDQMTAVAAKKDIIALKHKVKAGPKGNAVAVAVLSNCKKASNASKRRESIVRIAEDETFIELVPLKKCSLDHSNHESDTADTSQCRRETWNSNADFLLSIIGFAVDLANVWRFPYLCYRNGGGAFLIPYTLMLLFGAIPLFYMELIIGQYNHQGPISVWKICPIFKGVGFCAVVVSFFVSFYYNVIIGWAVYYFVSSFRSELPWMHCNNSWNTENCFESMLNDNLSNRINTSNFNTPASEYFNRAVLEVQRSDGLHDIGLPKWQLIICVFFVYLMLYFSLFKGVKSTGKVVWATATLPYVLLTILLIRGLMLPGAVTGISYYLHPELSKLAESQVWVDAAVQIFYSVGAGFGVHLSYASYNPFHNNCYKDCMITACVNSFTSFFSGFVIFTYLGFMSHKQGVPISSVATEGPGLVFQVYPEAVATLPMSQIWSMLFFFMLIMLGLDSAMGGLECVITGLMDEFHCFFKKINCNREIFTLIVISISFTASLVNITPGGIYMFTIFDTYSAGISLLCSALFEAIAVSWIYGLKDFSNNIEHMLDFKPGLYWRICWKFISPFFLLSVIMFAILYPPNLQYNDYLFPVWAAGIGWVLAFSSIMFIPLVAIVQLIKTPGTFKQKVALSISPISQHEAIRQTNCVSRFRIEHWTFIR